MCILIMYYCEYKIVKLDHQKFDYNPTMLKENEENCNKLLKLTVMSCDLLDLCQSYDIVPTFFDLDKGIAFNFKQTLKMLGFPGFKCRAKLHDQVLGNLFDRIAIWYEYYDRRVSGPKNQEDSLSIIKLVRKTYKTFQFITSKEKCKRNSQNLYETLKLLTVLEKAELNFLGISNKKKMLIINNLNVHLLSFKFVFFQPISFLLYVGRRFRSLQNLDVAYLGNKFTRGYTYVEESKYFDELNGMNLIVFKELKSFSIL